MPPELMNVSAKLKQIFFRVFIANESEESRTIKDGAIVNNIKELCKNRCRQ